MVKLYKPMEGNYPEVREKVVNNVTYKDVVMFSNIINQLGLDEYIDTNFIGNQFFITMFIEEEN